MKRPEAPRSPIIIDPSGAGQDGQLHPWMGFNKETDPHTFYGRTEPVPQIGPMPPPETNPKRYSL